MTQWPSIIGRFHGTNVIGLNLHFLFLFPWSQTLSLTFLIFCYFSLQINKLHFPMVCSLGSGKMAVMARLLAAGSFSQSIAGTIDVRFNGYMVFRFSLSLSLSPFPSPSLCLFPPPPFSQFGQQACAFLAFGSYVIKKACHECPLWQRKLGTRN